MRQRKKYSGRPYTNTDSRPRENIRTRRSGPNAEIFDEFAREITMKASRLAVREEPAGGRRRWSSPVASPGKRAERRSFKLRRCAARQLLRNTPILTSAVLRRG